MSMPLYWSYQCTFVLKQYRMCYHRLTTMEGDEWLFVLGCSITLLICVLSTYNHRLKHLINKCFTEVQPIVESPDTDRKRINSESITSVKAVAAVAPNRSVGLIVALACYYLYYSIMHILVMLLIMTMNGYVIIAIILGLTIGYIIFEEPKEAAEKREEDLPVSCGGCG